MECVIPSIDRYAVKVASFPSYEISVHMIADKNKLILSPIKYQSYISTHK